jgi:hypothetical protein
MARTRTNCLVIAALVLGCASAFSTAVGQPMAKSIQAEHRLGFSGAIVAIREDYRRTKWPASHRTFVLRGANGRVVTKAMKDGGAGALTALSLYKRKDEALDGKGRAIDGSFVLIGARDCLSFDPVFLDVGACIVDPPCDGAGPRRGLTYLGRFDWGTGYDPPHGDFQLGWRFIPAEDGSEEPFCSTKPPST